MILWDRMFGTYSPPNQSIEEIRQGLPENYYEHESMWIAYFRPVKEFYENLLGLRLRKRGISR